MKVELISYTPDALTLLLRTKNTRMSFSENPADWPEEKRAEHWAYMLDTIKSSWEFCDFTFQIDGVTRAFTHQFVRTRTGSYAQQSQRIVDARDFDVLEPGTIKDNPAAHDIWAEAEVEMRGAYAGLVERKVPLQDARGILPTNILTSITAKFNLRTLHDMAKLRLCTRTAGEYQDCFRLMRERVIAVYPWAEPALEVHCVATGTCAFPRYGKKECPIYLPEMDRSETQAKAKAIFWSTRHYAAPVAKDGKAV